MTRPRRPFRIAGSLVLVLAVLGGACSSGGDDTGDPARSSPGAAPNPASVADFRVALSAGSAASSAALAIPVVAGTALTESEIGTAVEPLAPLAVDEEADGFNRPPESIPRPRVGETIDRPFGAAERSPVDPTPAGALDVVRYQPEGDVDLAPSLSVTFNQPMVELATLDQLDQVDVPVRVTPALDGRWRWIGTRTLRFEFDGAVDRLPMATAYSVEIPAGTKSATGAELADAVQWTFRTPAPQVVTFAPHDVTVDTEPVFVAVFDQRIDADAVIDTVVLTADADVVDVRVATREEIEAQESVRRLVKDAPSGRWIAFRGVDVLPYGARLDIALGPDTPSAEGPRLSERVSKYRAETYSALAVEKDSCGYGEGCRPGSTFSVEFNNALDRDAFTSDMVTIAPDVPASIGVEGTVLVVNAATEANRTYAVTISRDLRDEFGQTLADETIVEFEVGEARPMLRGFERQLITTDPMADSPQISVTSAGHETLAIDVYRVEPSQWFEYQTFVSNWSNEEADEELEEPKPGFPLAFSTIVDVAGGGSTPTETVIDLGEGMPDGVGHRVVVVSPTRSFVRNSEDYWQNRPTIVWTQTTKIGVDAMASRDELIAWATDLRDGAPLDGTRVQIGRQGESGTTDAEGLARIPLSRARYLTATLGEDSALLLADSTYEWDPQERRDAVVGYAFNDRGLYRPGETVHIKGWFRRIGTASGTTVRPLGSAVAALWSATDAFGNKLGEGGVDLNAVSGFDLAIDLPRGAALGTGYVSITTNDDGAVGSADLQFDIQEFRRPEFEVLTRAESAGPHLLTEPVTVAAEAKYFAGGTLGNAPATWLVSTRPASYAPPNQPRFSFGEVQPWWLENRGYDDFGSTSFTRGFSSGGFSSGGFSSGEFSSDCCFPESEANVEAYSGRTDATGTHYVQLDFEGETPDLPITVAANAAVEDVNRQSFASDLEVLVHPASLYVGLRTARQFVRAGEAIDVEAIVTDIDGEAVADRTFVVTAARIESRFENGEWTEETVDPTSCELSSETVPVSCALEVATGGEYRIRATVSDDDGGTNRTQFTRWVSGSDAVPSRTVEQETATVVPDRDEYAPGDTAELLVVAPFSAGSGLLTTTSNGVTDTQRFDLDDGSAIVDLAITDDAVPSIDISIDLAGQAQRLRDDGTADPAQPVRPAFATAALSIPVQPVEETLAVTATPREATTTPGARSTIDVQVDDSDGAPVGGVDVAVMVVDESVLSLIGYETPDPIGAFYAPRSDPQYFDYLRNTLVLAVPDRTAGSTGESSTTTFAAYRTTSDESAPTPNEGRLTASGLSFAADGTDEADDSGSAVVAVRTNFDALALFAPEVRTNADGEATVALDLPDNLTRYRVMAIAADDTDAFGAGESTVTARLPLQVRPSPPRFANFGDRFELPVVLQNQTDEAMDVDVVLETTNLSNVDSDTDSDTDSDAATGAAGRRVEVPANDRIEVRFPVETAKAGTARFRVSATQGDVADDDGAGDIAVGQFPVYTPVTTEAFATYGVVDDGAIAQPLRAPDGVVSQFGGLEIDTSSTALQALTDAVVYLDDYDYQSADAYASRITALVALRDVFAAFGGDGVPTPDQLDARIRSDVAALLALQRDDGGFSPWTPLGDPQPYVSVQATEALVLADAADFTVEPTAKARGLAYVATIETHTPADWPREARLAVSAYALRVRARAGDRDPAKAERLFRERAGRPRDDLPLDVLAWLWPVVDDAEMDAEIERAITNRANDTPAGVAFATGYDDGTSLVLASDRRTDGIVLDALISERPDSELIPKVVSGLIGNQVNGRWSNIQENGFILVAMQRYFATFEAQTPEFVAQVWLGEDYSAEHTYSGRTTTSQHTLVPMRELLAQERGRGSETDIVVGKDGPGRLYYRLGLRYAPSDLALDARDEGFVVDRVYEAVNDEDDVTRSDDGTWLIKPGAMVRVRVTMVADAPRTNMVLLDPLPAGLEVINPDLPVAPEIAPVEGPVEGEGEEDVRAAVRSWDWDAWSWFDHENRRDDRVEAYSAYLGGGTYEYSYVARATTPGEFVVPPARAEEIYAPEVFGRSATDRVAIRTA